jgi:hypothetical protein
MKYLALRFILVLISYELLGQNYDTRFQLSTINCETNQVCYNVQLKPNGSGNFNLAGQNYRIFYNSSIASYTSGQSLLPAPYGEYTVVQNVQGANAGDMNGPLEFEATLGFLNYAIDLNDTQNGGIMLPSNEWTSTSNLCFRVDDEVLKDINACMVLVWGRSGLTDMYATAFVEVSRWVSANNTTSSVGIRYDDLDSGDGASSCLVLQCRPNAISISDVTVNETAGNAQIDVCISAELSEDITVNITTSDSTAKTSDDYAALTNAVVIIPSGQTCTSVLIPIINDTISETSEIFKVILSNPSSNASIRNGYAKVTINDDEAIPTVSIQDVTVNEDENVARISICLSRISSLPTTLKLNTSDSTAVSGSDFERIENLPITIPFGALCTTEDVRIIDNLIFESTEFFGILLNDLSTNAIFSDDKALITILDNDTGCQAKAPVIRGN